MIENPELYMTVQRVIEFVGTFAFAISGIRQAATKHYDWFGGFVCGFAVAIGGGTLRDVMLGVTPFWMTSSFYIVCTILAQVTVIVFSHSMRKFNNAVLFFDTLGLALFTIAGMQKSLAMGQPFWVAIILGCITGAAGGVIRDVLLNDEPVIFQKDIYASASVAGGICYWLLHLAGMDMTLNTIVTFMVICLIRFLAVRYHISLPVLHDDE